MVLAGIGTSMPWARYVPAGLGFLFQAEDGIRDYKVTGVQTCALPILPLTLDWRVFLFALTLSISVAVVFGVLPASRGARVDEIGRASCRERGQVSGGGGGLGSSRVRSEECGGC